jgi:hypothetical protein
MLPLGSPHIDPENKIYHGKHTYLEESRVHQTHVYLSKQGAPTNHGHQSRHQDIEKREMPRVHWHGVAGADIPGALSLRQDAAVGAHLILCLEARVRVVWVHPVLISR